MAEPTIKEMVDAVEVCAAHERVYTVADRGAPGREERLLAAADRLRRLDPDDAANIKRVREATGYEGQLRITHQEAVDVLRALTSPEG